MIGEEVCTDRDRNKRAEGDESALLVNARVLNLSNYTPGEVELLQRQQDQGPSSLMDPVRVCRYRGRVHR